MVDCGRRLILAPIPNDDYIGIPLDFKRGHLVLNFNNRAEMTPLERYKLIEVQETSENLAESRDDEEDDDDDEE